MKGDPTVLKNLQAAASLEATLANQYFLDHRLLKDMGLHGMKAGDRFKLSQDILKCILDRILFLSGTPEYQVASAVDTNSVTDLLKNALALETALLSKFQGFLKQALEASDDNTRNLYEHWIKWHENHNIDWIEEQLSQIEAIGEDDYIAQKI